MNDEDGTIYDVNNYHKNYIDIFNKKTSDVETNLEIYYKEVVDLNKTLDRLKLYLSNADDLIEINNIKSEIIHIKKRKNAIVDVILGKDVIEYNKRSMKYIIKYNSLHKNDKNKQFIGLKYVIQNDPLTYLRKIKEQSISNKCINCQSSKDIKHIQAGTYQCMRCMYITTYTSENIIVSEINKNTTLKVISYQKANYFEVCMNKLRRFKEPKGIAEIIAIVRTHAKANCIKKFTSQIVRQILKANECSDYYKHIPFILCKLNNSLIPKDISTDDSNKLISMFHEVLNAWIELCDEKCYEKKSFFGYPYAIRKLLELLGNYDDYLPLIPLNNKTVNIYKNDRIWYQICERLRYEYIPTYRYS